MENQKTIWELIDSWLSSTQLKTVDLKDVGRIATIINIEFKNTKYGARLLLTLDFGTEKKGFFVGKKLAQTLISSLGSSEKLLGQKVRIISVKYLTNTGIVKDIPMLELLKQESKN